MKFLYHLAGTLVLLIATVVPATSLADQQTPGSSCTIIDLSGHQYYVNNSTQYLAYSGPLLTNMTGNTLWATCPLMINEFASFNASVVYHGLASSCVICKSDSGATTCYTMTNNQYSGGWYVNVSSTYVDNVAFEAWSVQCKLRSGDAILQVDLG